MATMPACQAHCGPCARRVAPACSAGGVSLLGPSPVRAAWRRLGPGAQAVQARGCGLSLRAAAAVEEPEVEDAVDDLPADVPQQHKIRIKLKCYFSAPLEDSCNQIIDAVLSTGATVSGPVYLPTRRKRWTVLRSPHVNKDSREQFELRTHSRLIDVKDLTPGTIDELMKLELPAGVDVEVKL